MSESKQRITPGEMSIRFDLAKTAATYAQKMESYSRAVAGNHPEAVRRRRLQESSEALSALLIDAFALAGAYYPSMTTKVVDAMLTDDEKGGRT